MRVYTVDRDMIRDGNIIIPALGVSPFCIDGNVIINVSIYVVSMLYICLFVYIPAGVWQWWCSTGNQSRQGVCGHVYSRCGHNYRRT